MRAIVAIGATAQNTRIVARLPVCIWSEDAKAAPAKAPTIVLLNETGTATRVSPRVKTMETTSVVRMAASVPWPTTSPAKLPFIFDPSTTTPRMIPAEQRIVASRAESVPEPLSFPMSMELLFQPKTKVRVPASSSATLSSIALRD